MNYKSKNHILVRQDTTGKKATGAVMSKSSHRNKISLLMVELPCVYRENQLAVMGDNHDGRGVIPGTKQLFLGRTC